MSVPPIENGISSAIQSNIAATNNAGINPGGSANMATSNEAPIGSTDGLPEFGGAISEPTFLANIDDTLRNILENPGGVAGLTGIANVNKASIGQATTANFASGITTLPPGAGDTIASARPGISTGKRE
ncbi:MAG: hypothetical protein ACO2XZ_00290 [Rickettsiales bacterium]